MNFKIAACTDVGIKRMVNQDSLLIKTARTGRGGACIAAVCDGVGGMDCGEVASAEAVRRLSLWFEEEFPAMLSCGESADERKSACADMILRVNARILQLGRASGARMGTTLAMLLLVEDEFLTANVGDSRVYLMRKGIKLLTKDHSLAQREAEQGRMIRRQTDGNHAEHILLRCVGIPGGERADFTSGSVTPGSAFLLCSDGFRHMITEDEIYKCLNPRRLTDERSMREGLLYLTELNKKRKEADNISAAMIRCD